jgi:folate-binding protein YgfZ
MTSYYLRDRAIIKLLPTQRGENVGAFLQGLLTNDVEQIGGAYAALLSPQGKVLFDLFVEPEVLPIPNAKPFEPGFQESGAFLIDCEATQADALVRRLSMYRLRRSISIEIDPTLGVWWESSGHNDGWPDKRLTNLGYRGIGKLDRKLPDGSEQFRKRRLEYGVCEGHAELSDLLWLECNAAELNGVSFTKGCYVGQENTARMNWRAKVNRRLVVVPLADSDPKRQRAAYPELGLAVDHLRVEDIRPEWRPAWLQSED